MRIHSAEPLTTAAIFDLHCGISVANIYREAMHAGTPIRGSWVSIAGAFHSGAATVLRIQERAGDHHAVITLQVVDDEA